MKDTTRNPTLPRARTKEELALEKLKNGMTFFVLRKIGTRLYMPQVVRGVPTGRMEFATPEERIPRFFGTEEIAYRSLTWWLKGVARVTFDGSDWEFKKKERWPLNYEVIPIDLTGIL